jgi:putative CocE/NonD family hydrolase
MSYLRSETVRFLNDAAVPMRDGVSLSADVYLPVGDGPWPVLLTRTPYDNTRLVEIGIWWAERGYAYVGQDVRGRYDSEGTFIYYHAEVEDGYDTIDWIGRQAWCDGNVGMTGGSYLGQTQYLAAITQHPLLKAICPRVMGDNLWDGRVWTSGAFALGSNATWSSRTMTQTTQRLDHFDWPRLFRHLPLSDIPNVMGKNNLAYAEWTAEPEYGEWWEYPSIDEHYEQVTVPALHIGGWYDLYARGVIRNFAGIREHGGSDLAREHQHVIYGPWNHPQAGSHFFPGYTNCGDREFGSQSKLDTLAIELAWFDHWLKGVDNGIDREPPVRIFVMGADVWREEAEWPLARTEWTPWYLSSDGNAQTLVGDGTLSPEPPAAGTPPDTYRYDPENPVPTRGGCNCCNPEIVPWGVFDQREIEFRPDVLCFTSTPLEQDLEITGPVKAVIHASTDGPDTDFTAKLCDVYPDGRSWNLCDGIVRGRHRNGRGPAEFLMPGHIYEFEIDLWVTSNVFKAGHRIRLEISSSNFPRFSRNLNTDEPVPSATTIRVATNTVYHDADHPSHILLPVIPAE